MWITADAYADDSSSTGTDANSSVTITDNITDTENLLGSHATEVSDAIAKTEKETGVHVHLLYLSSFNSEQTPQKWASTVLESTKPKANTVLLAVAANDGNLVVAVSSNSDEWLKQQKTVDALSEAAQQQLMESTPNWSGAATAMMGQIAKSKKTSTSSSTVTIGVIAMGVALAALVVLVVVMVIVRRRREVKKDSEAEIEQASEDGQKSADELQEDIQETSSEVDQSGVRE
ncbi:TPM domain-containing protein [Bifidobacterium breve]|uniref:TPM domain-containing protein n=1 Tax=Bifidobacterium breve TaxID=1685 RepID=UPI00046D5E76|nr:TPM domain-containing protein [Bifidobacterium breve]